MNITLFTFKTNPTTVVKPIGNELYQIVWTKSMEDSDLVDSTWMISRQWAWNLVPLTEAETKIVVEKFNKKFGGSKKIA